MVSVIKVCTKEGLFQACFEEDREGAGGPAVYLTKIINSPEISLKIYYIGGSCECFICAHLRYHTCRRLPLTVIKLGATLGICLPLFLGPWVK